MCMSYIYLYNTAIHDTCNLYVCNVFVQSRYTYYVCIPYIYLYNTAIHDTRNFYVYYVFIQYRYITCVYHISICTIHVCIIQLYMIHVTYMYIMCSYNPDIHWSENRIQQTLPSVISPCSHITTKLLVFWVWVHYACIICLKWKVICINAVAISCLCFAFFYTVTYSWYYYHVATFWPKYWHLPLFLKSISINNFILSHFVEFDAWAKYLFNPIIVPSPQCFLHGLL